MTIKEPKRIYEISSDNPFILTFIIGGVVAILAAILIFAAGSTIPMGEGPKLLFYTAGAIIGIAGVVLLFYRPAGYMEYYFLDKKGKCRLAKNRQCNGGCKSCIFAAAYLEHELAIEREQPREDGPNGQ